MAERWRHNICERDWFSDPKFSAHESGGFRMPTRVFDTEGQDHNGICCVCGVPTVSGIYVRADPNEMTCKGDHEHPDMWSPFLGKPVGLYSGGHGYTDDQRLADQYGQLTNPRRDDDYTPEAMDRTDS